jgi:hypothetical protein
MNLQEVSDHIEISTLMNRYAKAVTEQDVDALAAK